MEDRKPQLAIGSDSSQSPLCGAVEGTNLALCNGSVSEASISDRSLWIPGLSQVDCLTGKGSEAEPKDDDQVVKKTENESLFYLFLFLNSYTRYLVLFYFFIFILFFILFRSIPKFETVITTRLWPEYKPLMSLGESQIQH